MKKVSGLLFVCMAFLASLIFISCKTNTTDERADLVKNKIQQQILKDSHGLLELSSFMKTNGTEQNISGMQMYSLEFTFSIKAVKDCWQNENFGFRVDDRYNFIVLDHTTPDLGYHPKHFSPGAEFTFTGKADLFKKDNGWYVETIYNH